MKHDHPASGLLVPRFLSHGVPERAWGLIILLASVAIAADQEPSYNGRPLSQWLGDMRLSAPTTGHEPYEEAIRAMGTNAIPTLLKWISYKPSPSDHSSQSGETVPPWRPNYNLNPEQRAARAQYAFESLGAVARPAIPELTRLARTSSDPGLGDCCATVLAFIGPAAIPSLLSLATNSPPWTRYYAIGVLQRFAKDPEAALVVPVLMNCLGDTNTDFPLEGPVEGVLDAIGPAVVVPALTNALRSASGLARQRAFLWLSLFEYEDPTNVPPTMVPTLRAAMRDPDSEVRRSAISIMRRMGGWDLVGEEWVRRHGTNTLHGITPDFFTNAPPR
jgi:hypothetical protein